MMSSAFKILAYKRRLEEKCDFALRKCFITYFPFLLSHYLRQFVISQQDEKSLIYYVNNSRVRQNVHYNYCNYVFLADICGVSKYKRSHRSY